MLRRKWVDPSISEKLYHTMIQGVLFWGGVYLGVVGSNGVEAGRSSCGVLETGDKVEGKKDEGRFVAEGGGGKSDSSSGDTTAPDLLEQEEGGCGGMGGLMAYTLGMREGYSLQGRG